MVIGIDFDNTIVCYDQVFQKAARELELNLPDIPPTKAGIKEYLQQHDRENDWIRLQGYVYGPRMGDARPFPGVLDFFTRCKRIGQSVYIVSHRTRSPFRGEPYDLHQAAQEWLEKHGFYDPRRIGLSRNQVYFELTKEGKINRIKELICNVFIDDLPDLLRSNDFPRGVDRILFDPEKRYTTEKTFLRATTWAEIEQHILGIV